MNLKIKIAVSVLASALGTQAFAAKHIFNNGGLGCGKIISMRESTQMPMPSELRDEYGGVVRNSQGGVVLQLLGYVPGLGVAATVASSIAINTGINAVQSSIKEEESAKEAASATYKNVSAVEFRFDDGTEINIPVYVVSGMRYKVGARLNAMVSPKYGSVALGANILFAGMPDVGDSDYNDACRIDNGDARASFLAPLRSLVNESRIVNSKERRLAVSPFENND